MNKKCEGCPQNTACVRNVLRRSASEIIAWCKEKKKALHLTNHAISIGTNVPKGTIDRVFTEKSDILDVRMATLLPIVWYLAEKLGIADCNPQEQADPKEVARLTELAEDLRTTINRQNVDAKNARQDHRDEVATLIQRIGGWNDLATMHKIYTHIAQQDVEHYGEEMKKILSRNQHITKLRKILRAN